MYSACAAKSTAGEWSTRPTDAVSLAKTKFLVLDEAAQMLDIGFAHALRRIAGALGKDRQTMMFSATMPKAIAELASGYLTNPVRVEVSQPGKVADKVSHAVHFVTKDDKKSLLISLLNRNKTGRSLVFARTKHGAERLMKQLEQAGFNAASIHGNKSQGQRDRAITNFRDGTVEILVATDVAARGIDIPDIEQVYNYDLPNVPENYVHRIGRTARAGRKGNAIAFCSAEEMSELRAIEKVLAIGIEVVGGKPWSDETAKRAKTAAKEATKQASEQAAAAEQAAKPAAPLHSSHPHPTPSPLAKCGEGEKCRAVEIIHRDECGSGSLSERPRK